MGVRFEAYLEYDGENPDRNDFICSLTEGICYSYIKKWGDLHTDDLLVSCNKKHSLEVERELKDVECFSWTLNSWGLNKILSEIKTLKKEWELDEELDYIREDELKNIDYDFPRYYGTNIICDLQWLYRKSMEKCMELSLDPEKCYVVWWINY